MALDQNKKPIKPHLKSVNEIKQMKLHNKALTETGGLQEVGDDIVERQRLETNVGMNGVGQLRSPGRDAGVRLRRKGVQSRDGSRH